MLGLKTVTRKWLLAIIVALGMADPQIPIPFPIPIPMVPPPPPQRVAVPIPVPIPFAVPIPQKESTTTSTTTTTCKPLEEDSNQDLSTVKVIIPWPPFSWIREDAKILPFTNNNFTLKFPPQMPLPLPLPIGVPPPPPIVMVPLPPTFKSPHSPPRYNHQKSDISRQSRESSSGASGSTSQSDSSNSNSDTDSSRDKRKKRKKKKKYGIYRSGRRMLSNKIKNEINPVLSFVSRNGEVRLQKRLTLRDASLLLNTARDTLKTIQVQPDKAEDRRAFVLAITAPKTENAEDIEKKGTVVANVLSSGRKTLMFNSPYDNIVRKGTVLENILDSGPKTLVLHPPYDKTVSNISVTFNVAP